jgi:hypothetical protein
MTKRQLEISLHILCLTYKADKEKVISKSKKTEFVRLRHLFSYVIRKVAPKTRLKLIGEVIGGRDHTTVIHGRDAIQDRIDIELKTEGYSETMKEVEALCSLFAGKGLIKPGDSLHCALSTMNMIIPKEDRPAFNYDFWLYKKMKYPRDRTVFVFYPKAQAV